MITEIRYYYANSSNQPVGPFGRRELEALIQAGVLRPESPILVEGATAWSTVRQLNLSPDTPQAWTPPPLPPAQTAKDDPWWVALLGIAVPILAIVGLIYFWPYSLFMLGVATLISIPSWLRRRPK